MYKVQKTCSNANPKASQCTFLHHNDHLIHWSTHLTAQRGHTVKDPPWQKKEDHSSAHQE